MSTKSAVIIALSIFCYLQGWVGTSAYYSNQRCVYNMTPGECAFESVYAGMVWPIYWNYRLADAIISRRPVP